MPGQPARPPLAFLLHSLFGLKLSLFTLFICLTGTIAVVSDEVEWLFRPEVRASATNHAASWGEQLAAARAAYPGHRIEYGLAGEAPYLATRFRATAPNGDRRMIYVDPATACVTGESSWIGFVTFMRALHHYLFVPGDWGFYAVTSLGIVLSVSLVTGLIAYKKFWRGLFALPRLDRGRRVFWGDLHRLIGLWSSWFVLLMAATSLWYLAERVLYRAGFDWEPARTPIAAPPTATMLPLDRLVELALAAIPGLAVKQVGFPSESEPTVLIRGQARAWLVRDRTNAVELDPYTGALLARHRAESMSPIERWSHMADPLHFGDFGGLASKLVWFGFGCLMCLSALSGAIIHCRRTARAVGIQLRGSNWWRLRGLDFHGRWKWANVAAASLVPAMAYFLYWQPLLGGRSSAAPTASAHHCTAGDGVTEIQPSAR